jgi:ADP-heptose:LPS heptosyltransferase
MLNLRDGGSLKILVVSFDNIGDTVMATGVLEGIRTILPEARIGFWVKEYAESVVRDHPGLSWVHVSDPFWDSAPGRRKGSFLRFVWAMLEIRRVKYDVALVLSAEWRRSLAVALLRIPIRAGLAQRKSGRFLTHRASPSSTLRHITMDHHEILKAWLGDTIPGNPIPSVFTSQTTDRWVDRWLQDRGWSSSPVVVCHPFSGDFRRNWPMKKWSEFISKISLQKPDVRFIVLSGSWEPSSNELLNLLPEGRIAPLSGVTLDNVKGILRRASLFVGNDSGPAHLAAALGVSTIALFGKADTHRTGPVGKGKIVCFRQDNPSDIQADVVMEVANELLQSAERL